MRILPAVSALVLLVSIEARAQYGCTDLQALNYNPSAVFNDGSCQYPSTTLSSSLVTMLQTPALDENSGMVFHQGFPWTHVDDTYEELYRVDTLTGNILQTLAIPSSNNTDWEDVQADSAYVYIGDIGNNNGNRTDLRFYRMPRWALDSGTVSAADIDTISFTYSDQIDFTAAYNNTRFDAEAFIVINDTIHVFSKDWVLRRARRYVLPATPGSHVALLRDSIAANGLITGAAISQDGVIALIGYDNVFPAPCFAWMLFDYQGSELYSGNKRFFSLGTAITLGQTESITFVDGYRGFFGNERFQQSVINVAPALRRFDFSPYLTPASTSSNELADAFIAINPQPASGDFSISFAGPVEGRWRLMTIDGKEVLGGEFPGASAIIGCEGMPTALYLLEVIGRNNTVFRTKVVIN